MKHWRRRRVFDVCQQVKIRDLLELIAEVTGFTGEIRWDPTKPDGPPRRALDTSRPREVFGFEASTSFRAGLRLAVGWCVTHALDANSAAS